MSRAAVVALVLVVCAVTSGCSGLVTEESQATRTDAPQTSRTESPSTGTDTASPASTRTATATSAPTATTDACDFAAGYLLSVEPVNESAVTPSNATAYANLTSAQQSTFDELREGRVEDAEVDPEFPEPVRYNGTLYVVEQRGSWDECR